MAAAVVEPQAVAKLKSVSLSLSKASPLGIRFRQAQPDRLKFE